MRLQKGLKSDFYLLAKCKTFKTFSLRRKDEKTKSISYAKTYKKSIFIYIVSSYI